MSVLYIIDKPFKDLVPAVVSSLPWCRSGDSTEKRTEGQEIRANNQQCGMFTVTEEVENPSGCHHLGS